MDVCLITGTSTGIGRATALHLARNGYKVRATMRDTAKAGPLRDAARAEGLALTIDALDVCDATSITAAIERIEAEEGRVDVLVNNAGLSNACPVETYPEDEHRTLFEANYWGPVRLIQRVLPGMRARRHGAIVNVSSLLGRIAWGNQAAYCASKYAIEALSESLAQEVAPFGIRVVIVEPGVVASAIFDNTPLHYDRESPYRAVMRRNGRFYQVGIAAATPAGEIADTILQALRSERPRLRHAHGWGAQAIAKRAGITDEDFVAMAVLDDDAYYDRMRDGLGLDLARKS